MLVELQSAAVASCVAVPVSAVAMLQDAAAVLPACVSFQLAFLLLATVVLFACVSLRQLAFVLLLAVVLLAPVSFQPAFVLFATGVLLACVSPRQLAVELLPAFLFPVAPKSDPNRIPLVPNRLCSQPV